MKKNLLLATLLLPAMMATAQGVEQRPKLNASLSLLMSKYQHAATSPSKRVVRSLSVGKQTYNAASRLHLIIDCENAQMVGERLDAAGYKHTIITETHLTAEVPITFVDSLAAMPEVKLITLSRRFKRNIKKAREISGVDKVIKGTDLETPFTGKGVILGVIDQGFEYRHAAFNDKNGNSRVRSVWDRTNIDNPQEPTTIIPIVGQKDYSSHATHVTAIAAGESVNNNNLQGVAPEAEIIMIPSDFGEAEVIEDVHYIKQFAEKEQKPWVVNMSFGSQLGPHDGSQSYDKALDRLTGKGAFIVAANGNEGQTPIHTMGTLNQGEERYIIFEETVEEDRADAIILFTLWNQSTDGKKHLNITPMLSVNDTEFTPDATFWKEASKAECIDIISGVSPENNKQYFTVLFNCLKFEEFFLTKHPEFGSAQTIEVLPALKIELEKAETSAQTFHLWMESNCGSVSSLAYFEGKKDKMLRGDSNYLVGEGASCIPSAISVGSYNSTTKWHSKFHQSDFEIPGAMAGSISAFSSPGPYLGTELKPIICAPGSYINSAFNKYDKDIKDSEGNYIDEITEKQTVNQKDYYFGMQQGTSMASPFVAGVLCLWLQANPNLDNKAVTEVLRKTAIRDQFTGADEWTPRRGYGKIDAYAGLKEVLRMGINGIEHVANSQTPVTLQKSVDDWKILFNNPERYAIIRIYTTAGRLVNSLRLDKVVQGQEELLNLKDLTPGAYLVNIETVGSHTTRRVLVK